MKIIIDADACPVKPIVLRIAEQNQIPCIMVCDVSHELNSDYASVVTVDQGRDSADFKIVSLSEPDDVVVTQDYGLASLLISKNVNAIHPNGKIYDADSMDLMLYERFMAQKARNAGNRTKNMRKRAKQDDLDFEDAFIDLICKLRRIK